MLTVIVVMGGKKVMLEVEEPIVYRRLCPYLGDHWFETENPDQIYCTRSHKVMWWQKNHDLPPKLGKPPLIPRKSPA